MTTSSHLRPDLTDKVVVVTGSSRGIGKAIAIACAQRGAAVVLNGRNQERLASAKAAVEEHASHVHVVCGDVSDPKEGRRLIEEAVATFGRLDLLVNNVGVSMRGAMADLQPEVFQTVFASNVFGTVNPTIPAIPELRKTKGSIIFISSLAGIRGLPSLSAYCSSKMALRALAESIRIEEHAHGIHVGLIQVGITEIEHNKETIAADGSLQVLRPRQRQGPNHRTGGARRPRQHAQARLHHDPDGHWQAQRLPSAARAHAGGEDHFELSRQVRREEQVTTRQNSMVKENHGMGTH